MRIVHVVGERGYSGGEVQLRLLLAFLAERGHENRLVLQPAAAFGPVADELGLPHEPVAMRGSLHLGAARRIRRAVRAYAPDLLHLADARAHKLGALAFLGRTRPPTVVTRRIAKDLRRGPVSRRLYGTAVDAVVAISDAVAATVRAVGTDPARIHVIHDGVEPTRFDAWRGRRAEARTAAGLPATHLVIVTAARLDPAKGQATLLAAFARLRRVHPDAFLVLAGEGPERAALEALVAQLGLDGHVELSGRRDVPLLLGAADLACVPSRKEGLSVFALEAQAAGIPVVASRVGGLPEAVADGETGLLVPPGDVDALAHALTALAADPDRRAALGVAGRRRVFAQFTADHMAAATLEVYAAVAALGP